MEDNVTMFEAQMMELNRTFTWDIPREMDVECGDGETRTANSTLEAWALKRAYSFDMMEENMLTEERVPSRDVIVDSMRESRYAQAERLWARVEQGEYWLSLLAQQMELETVQEELDDFIGGGWVELDEVPPGEEMVIQTSSYVKRFENRDGTTGTRLVQSLDYTTTSNKEMKWDLLAWAHEENERSVQELERRLQVPDADSDGVKHRVEAQQKNAARILGRLAKKLAKAEKPRDFLLARDWALSQEKGVQVMEEGRPIFYVMGTNGKLTYLLKDNETWYAFGRELSNEQLKWLERNPRSIIPLVRASSRPIGLMKVGGVQVDGRDLIRAYVAWWVFSKCGRTNSALKAAFGFIARQDSEWSTKGTAVMVVPKWARGTQEVRVAATMAACMDLFNSI